MFQPLDLEAGTYAKFATLQLARGMEMLDELELQEDALVLDIGCGPGTLTKILAQRVPQGKVIGIDASPSMVAYAKTLGIENAEFLVMDATKIPYEDRFDLVFSNSVFHWIDDQEALLRGILRALKKGGLLRAQFIGHQSAALGPLASELCQKEPYRAYLGDLTWPKARFTMDSYRGLMERIGRFKDIQVWERESERVFDNEEHLKGWLSSMHRKIYTEPLPEALREPFFKDFLEKSVDFAKKTRDGRLTLGKGIRLHVRARKA